MYATINSMPQLCLCMRNVSCVGLREDPVNMDVRMAKIITLVVYARMVASC
jgi:hypothetical protein